MVHVLRGSVNGATATISTRLWGPNNMSTFVVATAEVSASLPVRLVAHYRIKTDELALKTEDEAIRICANPLVSEGTSTLPPASSATARNHGLFG